MYSSFLTLGRGEQLFQTKAVDGNSGLYFEDIGKIFFYNVEWKIVSNVNLTRYRIELNHFQQRVQIIKDHCDELKLIEMERNASIRSNEGCGPIVNRLGKLMADIEENDSNWFGRDTRIKRNIASELVLDDWPEDYSVFSEEFRNMSAHASLTSTSSEKRTSYISSTMNSYGKLSQENVMAVTDYADYISVVHNTLAAAKNGSMSAVRLYQLRTTIQDYISQQLLLLTTFSSQQKQYLNIMSLVGKKNAHLPTILSSDTLLSELYNIRNIVGEEGLDFPQKITSKNVQFLFQLSSPEISLFDDQIFLTFRLPLISKLSSNRFTLFKVTSSLYNVKDNLYSFVVPNHDFVAIDDSKEHYTSLTVDDLNMCSQISNITSIICKQTLLMSTLTSSECEISVLHKRLIGGIESIDCNRRYVRNNAEIFVKVLKPNSWLVTMPNRTKVRYMCEGKPTQELFIHFNGLLTIDSNCKFATDHVVLTGHNTYARSSIHEHLSHNFSEIFEMQLNLADRILSNDKFIPNNVPQVINFDDSQKLLRISYSVRVIDSELELTRLSMELALESEREFLWNISLTAALCSAIITVLLFGLSQCNYDRIILELLIVKTGITDTDVKRAKQKIYGRPSAPSHA